MKTATVGETSVIVQIQTAQDLANFRQILIHGEHNFLLRGADSTLTLALATVW